MNEDENRKYILSKNISRKNSTKTKFLLRTITLVFYQFFHCFPGQPVKYISSRVKEKRIKIV